MIDAIRNVGLKVGIYYSKRDWKHEDYEPVPVADIISLSSGPFFKMKDNVDNWFCNEIAGYTFCSSYSYTYNEFLFVLTLHLINEIEELESL